MKRKTTWSQGAPKNGKTSIVEEDENELPIPKNKPMNASKATGNINVFPSP